MAWLSDPATLCDLPFPSTVYKTPAAFHIFRDEPGDVGTRRFKFMGREVLRTIYGAVEEAQRYEHSADNDSGTVHLYGPLGAGKTNILAALTCLLAQDFKAVLYLPNCSELRTNPVRAMKASLSFALPQNQEEISQIRDDDIPALHDYLMSIEDGSLICIASHLDKFYSSHPKETGRQSKTREMANNILTEFFRDHFLLFTSYSLLSLPAALFDSKRKTISMCEGLSKVCELIHSIRSAILTFRLQEEMRCWWNHHKANLPTLSNENRLEVELMTGRLPLLLQALLHFAGRPYDDIKDEFATSRVLQTVRHGAKGFVESKFEEYKVGSKARRECVT